MSAHLKITLDLFRMANYADKLSPLSFVVLTRCEVDPLFSYFWHNREVEKHCKEKLTAAIWIERLCRNEQNEAAKTATARFSEKFRGLNSVELDPLCSAEPCTPYDTQDGDYKWGIIKCSF